MSLLKQWMTWKALSLSKNFRLESSACFWRSNIPQTAQRQEPPLTSCGRLAVLCPPSQKAGCVLRERNSKITTRGTCGAALNCRVFWRFAGWLGCLFSILVWVTSRWNSLNYLALLSIWLLDSRKMLAAGREGLLVVGCCFWVLR